MQEYEHVAEQELSDAEQEQHNDMEWLVSHEQGLRIMHRILASCGVWKLSYSSDSLYMAHLEGRRKIGLDLFAEVLSASPNVLERMNNAMKGNEDV